MQILPGEHYSKRMSDVYVRMHPVSKKDFQHRSRVIDRLGYATDAGTLVLNTSAMGTGMNDIAIQYDRICHKPGHEVSSCILSKSSLRRQVPRIDIVFQTSYNKSQLNLLLRKKKERKYSAYLDDLHDHIATSPM